MTANRSSSKPKRPIVTVIVAVRNGARNLQRCIDSVAKQTLPNSELIVMDGGSTDRTVEILKANASAVGYWESVPDRGIFHAWNKAVARAQGEWLCFLGADDYLWAPDTLEQFRPHLKAATPAHRVVYGALAVVARSGETIAVIDQPWQYARRRFFVAMSIPHPGTFHHRSLFAEHGPFDESFRQAGDYDFLLREFKSHAPHYVAGLIQAGYEEGGVTTRLGTALRGIRERRRALVGNGIPVSPVRAAWMYAEDLGRAGLRSLLGEAAMRRVQRAYRALVQCGAVRASKAARSEADTA
ncbi:MAG: glycosyltransferase family 2 protein [Alphaproteobacteria bacterium]|nr:glycosyltransferase family 2 protein [Alphaproteobacteria bacterium]